VLTDFGPAKWLVPELLAVHEIVVIRVPLLVRIVRVCQPIYSSIQSPELRLVHGLSSSFVAQLHAFITLPSILDACQIGSIQMEILV
jgi:hypothetical protein